MAIELAPLPWAEDALEPVISARTIQFHYGKHHQGYVKKLNAAIADTDLANASLVEIIRQTADSEAHRGIFNNAAQVWNHSFFWDSLTPTASTPSDALAAQIEADFGSLAALNDALHSVAAGQFGSGWGWLQFADGKLSVTGTANADTPVVDPAVTPLLTIDVWEHAYYLDHQNDRGGYLKAIISQHLNWEQASALFSQA